jgi:hypothetical protein
MPVISVGSDRCDGRPNQTRRQSRPAAQPLLDPRHRSVVGLVIVPQEVQQPVQGRDDGPRAAADAASRACAAAIPRAIGRSPQKHGIAGAARAIPGRPCGPPGNEQDVSRRSTDRWID